MSPLDLLVVAPLVFMVLSLMVGGWQRSLLALAIATMAALSVWLMTFDPGTAHVVGGWELPLGVLLRADGLAQMLVPAVTLTAGLIGIYALHQFPPESHGSNAQTTAFWPLYYLMWSAAFAAFLTTDLFNLYVTLEMASIAAVAMAAMGSVRAALRYLLIALLGSIFYLLGVVLVLSRYGTVDVTLLAGMAESDFATALALALMTGGLLIKAALFPLHGWLPPAHAAAPAPASALLSGLVVKIGFVIAVRLWFEGLAAAATPAGLHVLGGIGALAILFGSLQAIRQETLKALVAYSTVAQIGYLFLAFPLIAGAGHAWAGLSLHAVAHMIAKAAMFLAAGLMLKAAAGPRIADLAGLARAMPLTVTAFGLAAVSLMGLPPSGGFSAKFLLVDAALRQGQAIHAAVMLIGGLLAAVYLFHPLAVAFSGSETPAVPAKAPSMVAAPLALALAALLLGFAGGPLAELATGGAPATVAQEPPPSLENTVKTASEDAQ